MLANATAPGKGSFLAVSSGIPTNATFSPVPTQREMSADSGICGKLHLCQSFSSNSCCTVVPRPTGHVTEDGISLCLGKVIIVYLQVLACILTRLLQDACRHISQAHCNAGSHNF